MLVAKWFILHRSSMEISIGVFDNEKTELEQDIKYMNLVLNKVIKIPSN